MVALRDVCYPLGRALAGAPRLSPSIPAHGPAHEASPTIPTSLFTGVFSVVPTRRRRFLWAAWWSGAPEAEPFRAPDASSGGARSREEARAQAEKAAGQPLVEVDARWAGAWVRVLRGDPPIPKPRGARGAGARAEGTHAAAPPAAGSKPWALSVLGVAPGASPDEIRRAFRAVALRTHPDRGGEAAEFMDARRALDIALRAAESPRKRRR